MTTRSNDLILQYMQFVTRQHDGILTAISSMQRQNDNLTTILSHEITRINNNAILNSVEPGSRTYITRPRNVRTRSLSRGRNVRTHRPVAISPVNTDEVLNVTTDDSPVRVRPSLTQIGVSTRVLLFRDISNNAQIICPIDRERLEESDTVMQIRQCGHFFRAPNLRRHFENNTRCPLCRYDIRDYIPTSTYDFSSFSGGVGRRPSPTPPPPPPPTPLPPPPDNINPFASIPSENINTTTRTTGEILNSLDNTIRRGLLDHHIFDSNV